MSSADRRLLAIQNTLQLYPNSSTYQTQTLAQTQWQSILVLSDNAKVEICFAADEGGPTQVRIDEKVVSMYRTLSRTLAMVVSAVGTPHEHASDHVPKYPIVEIAAPAPDTHTGTEGISIADFWGTVYALFTLYHEQENIPVILPTVIANHEELEEYTLGSGLGRKQHMSHPSGASPGPEIFLSRAAFWQAAGTHGYHRRGWLSGSPRACIDAYAPFPHVQSFTRSPLVITSHPLRPPKPRHGESLYKRYCPAVGQVLEFCYFDLEGSGHLAAFHKWHNEERVNKGWGEEGTLEKHREYIASAIADPAVMPVMMSWDGELMGYLEYVWIKENHVSQYIPEGARDYDRGIHVLVGEDKFRGITRSETWLRAAVHYGFLADPRTDRVMGEPNANNGAILKTCQNAGLHAHTVSRVFACSGIFDFPYKRSVLTLSPRDRFFKLDLL